MLLSKVISGGQTGVDRAGLDAALQFGLQIGGTAPLNGWAEDGMVPAFYGLAALTEGPLDASIARRTAENIRNADATLVIRSESPSEGTEFTQQEIIRQSKPWRVFQISEGSDSSEISRVGTEIANWIEATHGSILNIAGPRQGEAALYWKTRECLVHAFKLLQSRHLLKDVETSREEAVQLFMHWDTIRWQGPTWLSGAAAVVGSIMSSNNTAGWDQLISNPIFLGVLLFLAAFGTVSVILQSNLIHYHRRLFPEHRYSDLPFVFVGASFLKTASAWLLLYTILLSWGLCGLALYGIRQELTTPLAPSLAAVLTVLAILAGTDLLWPAVRLWKK